MACGKHESGFLLVVAIVLLVVGSMLAAAMAYMVATSGGSATDNLQSGQALFLADSGMEYERRCLAQNLDWYESTTDPIAPNATGACATATTTQTLGSGTFTAYANVPATMLRKRTDTSTADICAYTIDRFPASGKIQIDDDIAVSGEFVTYGAVNPSSATCGNRPAFTGIARGVSVGTVPSTAAAHARGSIVYPVTQLITALTSTACATIPNPFQITDNSKFLSAGTIVLDDGLVGNHEEIVYTGSSRSLGVMTLTGVRRCQDTGGVGPGVTWAANQPVTALLDGSVTAGNEAEMVSVGTTGPANRAVHQTVQR
jgi:Tfp pilus assembly protein PilX